VGEGELYMEVSNVCTICRKCHQVTELLLFLFAKSKSTNYSTQTDSELIELICKDSTLAFAALYNRYRHETYRYIITLVKVPELAEDLVQDVFIKIWDVRGRLEIRHNFRSYLFRICHNSAIDLNKRIAADRRLLDQVLNHWRMIAEAEPFTQEELLRYDKLVDEALNTLSPQRRKVYELCKKENKSYEEVARELDISPGTVKTHMKQTLSLLRSYIRKQADIPILIILLGKFF